MVHAMCVWTIADAADGSVIMMRMCRTKPWLRVLAITIGLAVVRTSDMGLHGQETALPDLLVGEWSGGYLGQKQWWFTFRRDGTYDYVRSVNTQCAIAHSGRAILVGELLTLEPETITEQGSLPCRKSIEQENHLVHVKKTYAVGRRVSDGPNVLLFYEPGTGGPGVKSNFWVLRRGH